MAKVILNIGHGGWKRDPGAVGSGFKEHDWNKDFVLNYIVPELDNRGISHTRVDQGAYYSTIITGINKVATTGDFFISFHLNASSSPTSKGAEMLYFHTSTKSKEIAKVFSEANYKATGIVKRNGGTGILPRTSTDRGGALLYKTKVPGIIIESGFITNPDEMVTLESKKKELAIEYVNAIEKLIK